MAVGRWRGLRPIRVRLRLTQVALARLAGVSQQAISKLERQGGCPRYFEAAAITSALQRRARALGDRALMRLRPEDLFTWRKRRR